MPRCVPEPCKSHVLCLVAMAAAWSLRLVRPAGMALPAHAQQQECKCAGPSLHCLQAEQSQAQLQEERAEWGVTREALRQEGAQLRGLLRKMQSDSGHLEAFDEYDATVCGCLVRVAPGMVGLHDAANMALTPWSM